MNEIDVKRRADAERHYLGLRRRFWRFVLDATLFWALALPLFALGSRLGPIGKAFLAVPLLGFLACWAGAMLGWSALTQFRCPRCGKRFLVSWFNSLPTAACKHCGQYLG